MSKRMGDLNKRLGISVSLALFVGSLLAFSWIKWVGMVLVLTVAGGAVIGVWEYAQLARAKGLKPAVKLMMGVAFCEVFAFFISQKMGHSPLLPLTVLAIGIAAFFLFHFKESLQALVNIAVEFFGVIYITLPLCFILGTLYPATQHLIPQDGRWWLAYLIVTTKITDVGAYFVGRIWGKHRLAPVLSPKKTIEGAVAGFCCATLASLLFYWLGKRFSQGMFDLAFSDALWLGMLIGVMGQVGDLAESLLKRDASVKDSNVIPGLGGVLDMLDSLLFTSPIVYLFLRTH